MNKSEVLVYCKRGPMTESVHRGHIAVVDQEGKLLYDAGDPELMVLIRSTAKPLQALPLFELGGETAFGLSDEEIALICSSHSRKPEHLAAAASILSKIGCSEADLLCGIQDVCSGKHAGMLALAKRLQTDPYGYWQPDHPVQKHMLRSVARMCGVPEASIVLAVDGCGVPVFGLPLRQLAAGYVKLGTSGEPSCSRILSAIRAQPVYIAGINRFDTALLQATNGRVFGKMGAEGVYALTSSSEGIGAAIKIEDGSERALYPTVVELLSHLNLLSPQEKADLMPYWQPVIMNRADVEVGQILPRFKLRSR